MLLPPDDFYTMSTVREIQSAISRLTPAEMRHVRDWLDQPIEDQFWR